MPTSRDPTGSILFVGKPYPSLHCPRQYNTRLLLHAEHATLHATVTSSEDKAYALSFLLLQMTSKCHFSSIAFHSKWPDK